MYGRLLLSFVDKLKQAKETAGGEQDYAALSLSLRQILRLCRRLNAFPEQSLVDFWISFSLFSQKYSYDDDYWIVLP
jgi:hypothetical protein